MKWACCFSPFSSLDLFFPFFSFWLFVHLLLFFSHEFEMGMLPFTKWFSDYLYINKNKKNIHFCAILYDLCHCHSLRKQFMLPRIVLLNMLKKKFLDLIETEIRGILYKWPAKLWGKWSMRVQWGIKPKKTTKLTWHVLTSKFTKDRAPLSASSSPRCPSQTHTHTHTPDIYIYI